MCLYALYEQMSGSAVYQSTNQWTFLRVQHWDGQIWPKHNKAVFVQEALEARDKKLT